MNQQMINDTNIEPTIALELLENAFQEAIKALEFNESLAEYATSNDFSKESEFEYQKRADNAPLADINFND